MGRIKIIKEKWEAALSSMEVNDTLAFPIKSITSVLPIKSRLQQKMCVEGYKWEKLPGINEKSGLFYIKRIK